MDFNDTPAPTGPGKQRILALDLMRGYFILLIASIHLSYYPSFLGAIDGRGQLWVSEAEGFFLISGLLIGIIRRSDIRKVGYRFAVRRMWDRGAKLYLASIALTIMYQTIAAITNGLHIAGAKGGLDFGSSIWEMVVRITTLQYSYGWADFLGYYAVYMFLAPVVVGLLFKRLWWAVIALSLSVWVLRWSGDYGWLNPFLQWQVYFFIGSVIGYYWKELTSWMSARNINFRRWASGGAMAVSASIMVASSILVFVPQVQSAVAHPLYDSLLLHGRIGLIRPLVTLVVFAGLFAFVLRFETQIMKTVGKVLLPFGQNSLYVYIIQSAILFAIPYFVLPGNFWLNTAIEAGVIALAWIAVRRRFLFRIIPR